MRVKVMEKIDKIRFFLKEKNLDALVLFSKENTLFITGIMDFEGVVLVTKTDKVYCFTDSRYIEVAKYKTEKYGFVTTTVEGNDYYRAIGNICSDLIIKKIGFEDKFLSVYDFENLKKYVKCEFVGISSDLLKIRAIKFQWELESIKSAQSIAERAFDTILGEIKPGITENECKARLEYLMTLYGSEKTPFPTILISGAKTSMPHGTPNYKAIDNGDFITFDFGAVVNGYCSDMTRTVAVGEVTSEMRKVYDTVLHAQMTAVEYAKPGISGAELDGVARNIIDNAGYGSYFGHALGHGVGIEVHEEPRVSPNNKRNLETGNVITIEPGIYIPGVFGVRIEDMLYIDRISSVNLTSYSKKLIIL